MGSYFHSMVQARLARLLGNLNKFEVFSELSLEIDKFEYKPDVCLYPKAKRKIIYDITRMIELPILAIEILSPSQVFEDILRKVEIYFNAGIKSNWIVLPSNKSITVFSSFETFKVFSESNVIDNTIGIELSINEIFE